MTVGADAGCPDVTIEQVACRGIESQNLGNHIAGIQRLVGHVTDVLRGTCLGVRVGRSSDDKPGLNQRSDLDGVVGKRGVVQAMTEQDQRECATGDRSIIGIGAGTRSGIPDFSGKVAATTVVGK